MPVRENVTIAEDDNVVLFGVPEDEWVTERDIAGDLLADPDLVEETQGERVALLLEQEEEEGERDTVIDVEIV